jgi:hypothetical protein
MTSTITRFEDRHAPCGKDCEGDEFATTDELGLSTSDVRFSCGCQTHREEFHDGSVHVQVVDHHGKVLVDEELRGE